MSNSFTGRGSGLDKLVALGATTSSWSLPGDCKQTREGTDSQPQERADTDTGVSLAQRSSNLTSRYMHSEVQMRAEEKKLQTKVGVRCVRLLSQPPVTAALCCARHCVAVRKAVDLTTTQRPEKRGSKKMPNHTRRKMSHHLQQLRIFFFSFLGLALCPLSATSFASIGTAPHYTAPQCKRVSRAFSGRWCWGSDGKRAPCGLI